MSFEILLIGYGNMGAALALGWQRAGIDAASIAVTDALAGGAAAVREQGFVWVGDTSRARARIVVIAVKPQQLAGCLTQHRDACLRADAVLSIVAGKTIAGFSAALDARTPIVRAMPNTPAAIGEGVTVLCANEHVAAAERERCAELMRAVGAAHWVEAESLLDAVTAVSGSGPAYVFLFIECLVDAAIRAGLPADLARDLALQTVAGAALYARTAGQPLAELRARVTSPGGTTEAALALLLENHRLGDLIDAAVAAAAARSRELSQP